ncbi:hypothetical protein [uncultured Polaribacter sp.]|uniref:plasmid mobilization protein n=1 Tax=uncultured Polaribacter sp. TaxID=174711 RepID=UPI00261148F5|nr:hypothetical protein [uncultured Polaribacter sp.]
MKKENKTKYVRVRITKSEDEKIKKEAQVLGYQNNISQYLRGKILRKHMPTVNPNKLIDELYLLRAELNKIGSNLNQVANYTNFLFKNNYAEHSHIKKLKEIEFGFENKVYELKKTIDKTIDKTL